MGEKLWRISITAIVVGGFVGLAGKADRIMDRLTQPNAPISVTTPVKNPITGTESPITVVQRDGESRSEFFDRVVDDVISFQERLAKGR